MWKATWKKLRKNKLAVAGLFVIIIFIFLSAFAGLISPLSPDEQFLEFARKPLFFKAEVLIKNNDKSKEEYIPVLSIINEEGDAVTFLDYDGKENKILKIELISANRNDYKKNLYFILGTDRYGRDVLSRLLYGSRVSLSVGLISVSISLILGIFLGGIAGYFRSWTDSGVMWLINVVWSFPSILIVIAISVVLGKGFWQAFVAIGLTSWVDIARVVRGQFFSLRETEYIESARALGYSTPRIILKHMLPNAIGPIIVTGTVGLANAIIFEASLSFIGLGVQPPTASWGQMIYDGYKYIVAGSSWELALFPSLMIMITVFSINLFGDGLRDAFDIKMKN